MPLPCVYGYWMHPMSYQTHPTRTTRANRAIEAAELERWQTKPDRQLAYFAFVPPPTPRQYLRAFTIIGKGSVSTWLGTTIGSVLSARVYSHNFGGRILTLRVRGTNGAEYYGRASWDHGTCIWLRRSRHNQEPT